MEELASNYIDSAKRVFGEIKVNQVSLALDERKVTEVLDSAKRYFEDAKYYKEIRKFEVSLTSVAYCEGLLDALRMLGAVEFNWPTRRRKEGKK